MSDSSFVQLIDRDDARMWGREAFMMGLTLAECLDQIREAGCPARYLPTVQASYARARADAIYAESES